MSCWAVVPCRIVLVSCSSSRAVCRVVPFCSVPFLFFSYRAVFSRALPFACCRSVLFAPTLPPPRKPHASTQNPSHQAQNRTARALPSLKQLPQLPNLTPNGPTQHMPLTHASNPCPSPCPSPNTLPNPSPKPARPSPPKPKICPPNHKQ